MLADFYKGVGESGRVVRVIKVYVWTKSLHFTLAMAYVTRFDRQYSLFLAVLLTTVRGMYQSGCTYRNAVYDPAGTAPLF